MAEPGTPAPDLAALHARARRIENLIASRTDKVVKLLAHIETVIQPQTSGPRSSTRLAAHSKPRRKDVNGPPPWITSALSEAREEMAALRALAKDIITALSQVPEESPHAEYDVLGQGRKDPGREDVRQGVTPAGTSGRGSHEQAVLASAKSHAASKPSTQTIVATSPEVISDAAQQPQVHPADSHDEGSPRLSPPRDSGTAKQDDNAVAQVASTHQRRDAEDQAPANAHGDNSATSIEATGDPSSDASDEDTPMQEAEASPNATHLPGPTRHVADSRPDPSGEQEHESEGHNPDALMTGVEQPTCGRQDLPEATAITPPQAHGGEGSLELVVANAQPAEFPSPEDSTGRLASISTLDGDTATPLPITNSARRDASSHREETANTQTSTPSPSSGTTPQGSDTTEDTSRPTTPDTPLTSPDAPATDSPTKFTISAADMGEGLVQALNKLMSDPEFANEVSVPLPDIDLAQIQEGLDVDDSHCWQTGVRFEAGPKGDGYTNVFVSEDEHRLDWSKFCPGPVKEPTLEEAKDILNRFIDNPPDHPVPYIIGHLKNSPFNEALNPGPAILGDPDLEDLHSEYHHIGLDGSANRFHQEDGTWEDEVDGSHHGLCSYNEVYYGYKLWVIVKEHHISKFHTWAQATWNCTECSEGLSHRCLLIAPAKLERAGIDFQIVVSKPGKAVVTKPGQQHEIVNYGPCAARSMNFNRRGENMDFQKVVYCEADNMAPVYALHGARRIGPTRTALPSAPPAPPAAPAKKKPTRRRRDDWADAVPAEKKVKTGQVNGKETPRVTLESLQELMDKFRAENLLCKVPTLHTDQLPTERVLKLAYAVSSRLAIQQFHSMVQSWNGRAHLFEHVPLPGEDAICRIQHRALLVDKWASVDTLSSYLLRQSQFGLAKEVEAHRQGRLRTDSSFIDKVLERTRWTRPNYDYHYKKGKEWMAICGRNEGILPFLHHYAEPFNITPTRCLDLSENELSSLASLLDNHVSKALLKAGVAFQQAMEESRSVRFAWDRHEVDWNGLDENKLMSYLEVVDD
ncbi:JmjC domain-containing protein [Fusarium sp. LHS14.1]|nr:JmjC domain-containing protein [Fusarium sp. LHS14.1]